MTPIRRLALLLFLSLFPLSTLQASGFELSGDPYSRLRDAPMTTERGWKASLSVGVPTFLPLEMKYGVFREDPYTGINKPKWYLGAGIIPYPTGAVLSAYRATDSGVFYLRGGYTLMLLPEWGEVLFFFTEFDNTADRLIQFASISAGVNVPGTYMLGSTKSVRLGVGYFVLKFGTLGSMRGWYFELSSLLWSFGS